MAIQHGSFGVKAFKLPAVLDVDGTRTPQFLVELHAYTHYIDG